MTMSEPQPRKREPGVCIPWEEKRKELPEISGDEGIIEEVWRDVDALAHMYIWHCLVSF